MLSRQITTVCKAKSKPTLCASRQVGFVAIFEYFSGFEFFSAPKQSPRPHTRYNPKGRFAFANRLLATRQSSEGGKF
jgi:hypothetical protein